MKKEGAGFDLPIAVGILGAYGALRMSDLSQFLWSANWASTAACALCPACCPIAILRAWKRDSKSDPPAGQRRRGRCGRRRERLPGVVAARCAASC